MDGIILIDKPEGWTSFDVVAKIRGMVKRLTGIKRPKVGHTGTLDPAATGLLIICVGKATKRVPQMIKQDKTYEVELTLGKTSTTGDREGEISDYKHPKQPLGSEVERVLESFIGAISQVPPAFSAIKINGRKAYDLARAGKKVELKPRIVHIYELSNANYRYPILTFTGRVGSGTYIRSLAEDIGNKLGCGAYVSRLRRTAVGDFTIEGSFKISDLDEGTLQKNLA